MATPIPTPGVDINKAVASGGLQVNGGPSALQALQNLANVGYKVPSTSTSVTTAAGNVAQAPQTPVPAAIVGSTKPASTGLPTNPPTQSSADIVGTNAPLNPTPQPIVDTTKKSTTVVPPVVPPVPPVPPVPTTVTPANGAMDRSSTMTALSDAIKTYGTKGAVTASLQDQFNLPAKQADAVASYNAYQAAKLASDQQIASIYNQPGIGRPQADAQAREVSRINNANLANLAVIAQTASGNLTAAQSIIDSKLNAQFAPIKDQIDQLTSYISTNNNNLSDSDKAILNANLTVQTNAASQLFTAKSNAYTTAIQYGISDPSVFSAMDNATTLGGVYGALNGAINSSNGSTISIAPNVNGYDLTGYAPNDPNYVKNVNATSTAMGGVTSPAAADAIIGQLSPNSPVTGDMIMKASAKSGVDANTLMSVMRVESNFGTEGAGVANNNPGNVKFVGQEGATKGSAAQDGGNFAKFKDLQDGVNAMATSIASKKIDPSQIINTSSNTQPATSDALPTQNGQAFTALKQSAPPIVSSALYQLQSTGSAFIDLGKIPTASQGIASAYARQHNIPILDSNQAQEARTTDEAIRNIVNVIAPAWSQIAPQNGLGRAGNNLVSPLSALFDTEFYSNNKTFSSNKESLAQQISALSKSAPKLGLIGTAESALPNNAGYGKIAGMGGVDTYKDGMKKLNRTLELLNESLSSYIPGGQTIPKILETKDNSNGDAVGSTVTKNGVSYKVNIFGGYDPIK